MNQKNQQGGTATEYALLLALVFLLIVGSVSLFGQAVADLFVGDWPW